MSATKLSPPQAAPECAEFADVIEALLAGRRAHPTAHRAASPWDDVPRSWTREELCDVAYSSYRAMLRGTVRRPPRREVVLEIADYLRCSLSERNQLLIAAQYAIEHPGPSGAALSKAVEELRAIIDALPLPAYAVGRDWTLLLVNDYMLTILGLKRANLDSLPTRSRNVLRMLFDPRLPLRGLLEQDHESWSRLASFSVFRFVQDNLQWQYDAWYRALIRSLGDLPDFGNCWREAQSGGTALAAADGLALAHLTISRSDGRVLRMRPINIHIHDPGYPGIVSFLAADHATAQGLRELSLPSPVNRWGAD